MATPTSCRLHCNKCGRPIDGNSVYMDGQFYHTSCYSFALIAVDRNPEVEKLKHDIERHLAILSEKNEEIERLRAERDALLALLYKCDEAMSWQLGGEPLDTLMVACRKNIEALRGEETK